MITKATLLQTNCKKDWYVDFIGLSYVITLYEYIISMSLTFLDHSVPGFIHYSWNHRLVSFCVATDDVEDRNGQHITRSNSASISIAALVSSFVTGVIRAYNTVAVNYTTYGLPALLVASIVRTHLIILKVVYLV